MAVFWVVVPCSLVEVNLMMEAASISEALVKFYETTWCDNPKDSYLQAIIASFPTSDKVKRLISSTEIANIL
jgi:ABC-type uncharacterized transport system auxiliary subunit